MTRRPGGQKKKILEANQPSFHTVFEKQILENPVFVFFRDRACLVERLLTLVRGFFCSIFPEAQSAGGRDDRVIKRSYLRKGKK